jgi:hypothetical protein
VTIKVGIRPSAPGSTLSFRALHPLVPFSLVASTAVAQRIAERFVCVSAPRAPEEVGLFSAILWATAVDATRLKGTSSEPGALLIARG